MPYVARIGNFSCLGTLVICLANTILRFPAIDALFYRRVPPGSVAVGPWAPAVGFAGGKDVGARVD